MIPVRKAIPTIEKTLGSTVAVTDGGGNLVQTMGYYPSGTPYKLPSEAGTDLDAVTEKLHIGNKWIGHKGFDLYDNTARMHDPLLARFHSVDPLFGNYPGSSPWTHCLANPLSLVDPTGCDTINVSYSNNKWIFEAPKMAEGDDVFNVTIDGNVTTYTFSEGEYGKRVNCLNLNIGKSKSDFTLGIYHISGIQENGTGYYVTPGGAPSIINGSGQRIPEGIYSIETPTPNEKWQKPKVGGAVEGRGIKFHYGSGNVRKWTSGCFVISFDYKMNMGIILYDINESMKASQKFDEFLGASYHFDYSTTINGKKRNRNGSKFKNVITYKLILK